MWSERDELDSLLWEAAVDDMGIYPAATISGDVRTERTEWQDGWNAAVVAMTKKHGDFIAWAKALTAERRATIKSLLDEDGEPIRLRMRDGVVTLSISCGDTFMYACSDSEDFRLDELPEIARLWSTHYSCGLVAWIAQKRHAEPVKEYRYDPHYLAAKAALIVPSTPTAEEATEQR